MTDPAALRADYTRGNLDESDVADEWYPQLRLWFDTAAGDPAVLVASSAKIREALGWSPKYERLDDIVGSAWRWMQKFDATATRYSTTPHAR